MAASTRKYLALLVTFFLLASLSAHAFNATTLMHELDPQRHDSSAATPHSHFFDSDEPSEAPPINGLQHLALHSMGDVQPLVVNAFADTLVTPITRMTPRSYSVVVPGLPDRDPPFRPPQSD